MVDVADEADAVVVAPVEIGNAVAACAVGELAVVADSRDGVGGVVVVHVPPSSSEEASIVGRFATEAAVGAVACTDTPFRIAAVDVGGGFFLIDLGCSEE